MKYPLNRDKRDGDAWDGDLLKDWDDNMKADVIPVM